ncbi:hypothetical protein HYFRA_00010452 [Hymenoscyphus fraxineus]|uniref:Uncharacterized protein n=1 Tax=Hymenoscyphus fraxineus TaxID=746836 RepID=A0A9N9L2V4_9HELO|nr:hypothetical protein HYFRA_00010452 [Hymenoscyphus fraxineus]
MRVSTQEVLDTFNVFNRLPVYRLKLLYALDALDALDALPERIASDQKMLRWSVSPEELDTFNLFKRLYGLDLLDAIETLHDLRGLGSIVDALKKLDPSTWDVSSRAAPALDKVNRFELTWNGLFYGFHKLGELVKYLNSDKMIALLSQAQKGLSQSRLREGSSLGVPSKRKVVRVLVNGSESFARPDSGSQGDIISENLARKHGLAIESGAEHRAAFQMGNGKIIRSKGRCYLKCKLADDDDGPEKGRWFHVLKKCVAPLIVGIGFIRETRLMTDKRHLLVDSPVGFMPNVPIFKYMGAQASVDVIADGHRVTAAYADTGSDLNVISLNYAVKRKLEIDRAPTCQSRVMLPDGSETKTLGTVKVNSLQIRTIDGVVNRSMEFHVLPDLTVDMILGERFLEETNAFNKFHIYDNVQDRGFLDFKTLINLGLIKTALAKLFKPKENATDQQKHDESIDKERYRRNKRQREISKITDSTGAQSAQVIEDRRVRMFDEKHRAGGGCRYCRD